MFWGRRGNAHHKWGMRGHLAFRLSHCINKLSTNLLILDKEIKISIKLKQLYGMFLSDRKSPEYKELSGNVEQAVSIIVLTIRTIC